MRAAGLPNFRKLFARINTTLEPGTYTVRITNGVLQTNNTYKNFYTGQTQNFLYPVSSFGGTKAIVLSTTTWLGGANFCARHAHSHAHDDRLRRAARRAFVRAARVGATPSRICLRRASATAQRHACASPYLTAASWGRVWGVAVLGYAYVIVGVVCIVLALCFLLKYRFSPRDLGDASYITWHKDSAAPM
jgi:hypothetical protein